MNLSHLRYFVKLAQIKHYTKTAELLCITQPSLSHAISQLEKELGVPLFEKGPHGTDLNRLWQAVFRQRQFITQYSRQRYRNDKKRLPRQRNHPYRLSADTGDPRGPGTGCRL